MNGQMIGRSYDTMVMSETGTCFGFNRLFS